nr:hypothetical protein [Psychrobacter sp. PraFG1]UNK04405.1 hypothetical protein MN210_08565 [Psychrobacter sp. PraFG1]
MSNGTVNFAASDDTTTLNVVSGGTVNMESGNDTVNITTSMSGGNINLGAGDDTITVASYTGVRLTVAQGLIP